jgi:Double zinc ribbon
MRIQSENQSVIAREIKIVPAWAWGLAAIAFLAAQWYFNIAIAHHAPPPAAWARPVLGLLAGIGGGAYLLIIGYVNRDSKRRRMSPLLWTLLALIIPNGMGILLYFVLRQPLTGVCPQCGGPVEIDFKFCPRCSHKLGPNCPQCQRSVQAHDSYCPYCGTSLNESAPVSQPKAR